MWLLFVLSQIVLRRRYCSCSTDVSIIPCWVQEFAYYQGLPCPATLIKSVHRGPRIRARVFHLVSSWRSTCTSVRNMKIHKVWCSAWVSTGKDYSKAGLAQETRRSVGTTAYFITRSVIKPQADATPCLPILQKIRFWTSTSENT